MGRKHASRGGECGSEANRCGRAAKVPTLAGDEQLRPLSHSAQWWCKSAHFFEKKLAFEAQI
jgi:hypothetical protein